jgi:hypothetical protein
MKDTVTDRLRAVALKFEREFPGILAALEQSVGNANALKHFVKAVVAAAPEKEDRLGEVIHTLNKEHRRERRVARRKRWMGLR